jgi:serine/threonine protein phosphatase PrpC
MHHVLSGVKAFARGEYVEAMGEAFEGMDTELRGGWLSCLVLKKEQTDDSVVLELTKSESPIAAGTCATVAIVVPEPTPACSSSPITSGPPTRRLVVGNVGDVRAVLCAAGTAVRLTVDHEPTLDLERKRIARAGGFVDPDGRVNGYIMVSRSLGDFSGKSNAKLKPADQLISNVPDVAFRTLEPDDQFLIAASDGIWSIYETDQDVLNFIIGRLCYRNLSLPKVLEELLAMIYMLTKGSSRCDNKTVMVVAFLKEGETEQAWTDRVRESMQKRLPAGMGSWDCRDGVSNKEGMLTCELVAKKAPYKKK